MLRHREDAEEVSPSGPGQGCFWELQRLNRQGEGALGGRKPPLDPSCGDQRQWAGTQLHRERSRGWSKGQARGQHGGTWRC